MSTPTILWSQTKSNVNLKICLSDYRNLNFHLSDSNITFSCESNNLNYAFSFQTFKDVKDYRMNDTGSIVVCDMVHYYSTCDM